MGNGDWVCNVLRLYSFATAEVESEWTIGPIPITDGFGKEVMECKWNAAGAMDGFERS